ncbi:phosphoglycerate mutase-like protein [Pyrenochaeta sp. DS3sAY3a]|nr:phosphoglycerate mutase-like protein [Pyrenochaeta sp. DS3sAY3a]
MKTTPLYALAMLAGVDAAETILGAYIFHRHGDRTPKALAPTNLTALGYEQVYTSGQYFRSRYLTGDSKIRGINEDTVKLSQLAVTAPVDNVLQNSAMGFLQGLYPPVQTVQTLANGQNVQAPMDGYQLIPINTVQTGSGSEDSGWLQDASSCQNAKSSSNSYFDSKEYKDLAAGTKDFYSTIVPSINHVISDDQVNYKNAYVVYDIINVAEIHNSSIPNSSALDNSTLHQLLTLANAHEYGLAYNASDDTRAIAGMQLAGEILTYFNGTITSQGAKKFGIQFGAYATFLSFFGLADLVANSTDFTGVVDYASSMTFELFTTADISGAFPTTQDLQVRFLFHNGTASNASEPVAYPLFGGSALAVSYDAFHDGLAKFAVQTTEEWCGKCGSTTGSCAAFASNNSNSNGSGSGSAKQSGGSGISPAIGGVIGAFVTLAVVLGSLAAFMLVGGFRLVSKKRLAGGVQGQGQAVKA